MPNTEKHSDWHIVCGEMDVEQLLTANLIKAAHRQNDRYSLFLKIKYPNDRIYTGHWGPELLHVRIVDPYFGTAGEVYCTEDRFREIAEWFINNNPKWFMSMPRNFRPLR